MARTSIGFTTLAVVGLGYLGPALARDVLPVQVELSQSVTPPALSAETQSRLDATVRHALAANRGAGAAILASAVVNALNDVVKVNATAIAGAPTLAVAIAQEAMRVVVASPGLDAAARLQIAAAIASSIAKAAPSAAAGILVAVFEALPADEQTRPNALVIAQAIDASVPDAQVTTSVSALTPTNAPLEITTLTSLLSILTIQGTVSPH